MHHVRANGSTRVGGGDIEFPSWVQVLGPDIGHILLGSDQRPGELTRPDSSPEVDAAVDGIRRRLAGIAIQPRITYFGRSPASIPRRSMRELRLREGVRSLPLPTNTLDWRSKGKCRDADPELFFFKPGSIESEAAKRTYCGPCPVRGDCVVDAYAAVEPNGIRGGFDEDERQAVMVRQAARALQEHSQEFAPSAPTTK